MGLPGGSGGRLASFSSLLLLPSSMTEAVSMELPLDPADDDEADATEDESSSLICRDAFIVGL